MDTYNPGQKIKYTGKDSFGEIGTIEKFAMSHERDGFKWNTYYVKWDTTVKLGMLDDFEFIPLNEKQQ